MKASTRTQIQIQLAGTPVLLTLHHPQTPAYFRKFLLAQEADEPLPVMLDEDGISLIERDYGAGQFTPLTEFETLVISVSDALMRRRRAIFHGVAFRWKDRAWIFAAPSGVGKTTQYRNWKKLWGDEVEIICGDKPVLQFGSSNVRPVSLSGSSNVRPVSLSGSSNALSVSLSGSSNVLPVQLSDTAHNILVHPSPWPGKEGYSGTRAAPLAGIICLEQGERNAIRPMTRAEAVAPVFVQWFTFAKTEEQINLLCDLEEELLETVPVWKLTNVGTPESALLTREVLETYLGE